MAYITGTVSSPAQLRSAIISFCTTNGWTLTGSVLSRGTSFNEIIAEDATTLSVRGLNDTTGTINPCPYKRYIHIPTISFPITYYMQTNVNPDLFICVIQYEVDKFQQIIFGNISKMHPSAFPGGNWCWASKYYTVSSLDLAQVPGLGGVSNTRIDIAGSSTTGINIPFARTFATENSSPKHVNGLYLNMSGILWDSGPTASDSKIHFSEITSTLLFNSPNTWNQQTHLVPMHIMFNANGGQQHLGFIEHIRYIRIDNYDPGDIITLGAEKWKVFPWYRKDTTSRNGFAFVNPGSLGTYGFCFRYDGV